MLQATHHLRALLGRPLAAADAWMNRLYGWRHNPLYQSGTLVVASFLVMLVTGLYLLLFYRIGAPYESIERIQAQAVAGRWIRALHRYASDLAVAAAAVHALRLFVQERSHGPRTLAWLSGLVLFGLIYVCGWTGYVMVWDGQALVLAVEGARLMDALPIFSEPLARTFVGERPMPSAFFFLNLFLHIAIPVGMALLLWVHVSRVARAVLLPPRPLLAAVLLLLFAASLLAPAPLGPPARLDALAAEIDLDLFYAFWLPLSRRLEPGAAWAAVAALSALALLVPLWSRPRRGERLAPSVGNERLCTGCDQCTLDCPYEAIAMLPRDDRPGERFARVTPELCVSCGICAGSCAPMAIGPPERTGRDELAQVRAFVASHPELTGSVVVAACRSAADGTADAGSLDGAPLVAFSCAGAIHSSALEHLLRAGASGILVWSCPPRDCWHREGPRWLEERLHHGREAELRESVDRRRIRVVHAGAGEAPVARRALEHLRVSLAALARPGSGADDEGERECARAAGGS